MSPTWACVRAEEVKGGGRGKGGGVRWRGREFFLDSVVLRRDLRRPLWRRPPPAAAPVAAPPPFWATAGAAAPSPPSPGAPGPRSPAAGRLGAARGPTRRAAASSEGPRSAGATQR